MLKFSHTLVFMTLVMLTLSIKTFAMPAKKGNIRYTMSDGSTITVKMFGDEHHHFYTTTDGYILLRDDAGDFRYAAPVNGKITNTNIKATETDKRPDKVKALLNGINKNECLAIMQNAGNMMRKQSRRKIAEESKLTTFPTKGSPKCLCILVEFQDKKFKLDNPYQAFYDQLNKEGYNEAGATGSIKDYFTAGSNGQFTPRFDLYGPVTLPHNMSYYGGNDQGGNDLRPAEMVTEACALLDSQIDFSLYDNDNDGIIDNIYIFYAGYGEADGGPANSVWPHSWDITDAFPGSEYFFDGKQLNHYACSNELKDGAGQTVASIGGFCHEFSHVMGLPDLYSTTYTNAFTPGAWSIMDYGSYNNEARTPPTHTAYERYCLGWVEPVVLNDPCNVTMRSMHHIGHYNDVYMIKCPNKSEYYILENRQQTGWDEYLPSHGMLVWHINFVPDIWNMNICNIGQQYIDIVEADNQPDYYSIEGDPFPGSEGVTSFTDDTEPSMKPWTGEKLYAPITEIKENSGIITFMFKGGEDIFDAVTAEAPVTIKAGGFTAKWKKVSKATGYLLSIYTKAQDGTIKYQDGWIMKETGDVDNYDVTGLMPETTYYYEVRATNGNFYSKASNEIEVTTTEPTIDFMTVNATQATAITEQSFTANWDRLADAEYYTLNVYAMQLGEPFTEMATFTGNSLPEGWSADSKTFDSRGAYSVETPSIRLSDGQNITTRDYPQDVREINLWYRGNSPSTENSITIYGRINGDWVEISKTAPVTNLSGGAEINITEIPAGCRQVKISFSNTQTGNVFIDNIIIGYGGIYEEKTLTEYNGLNVGNVNSHNVTGLAPGGKYSYSVFGHAGELKSKESARISVALPAASGIADTNADECLEFHINGNNIILTAKEGTTAAVYNPNGILLDSKRIDGETVVCHIKKAGVHIVRIGDRTTKVMIW